MAVKKTVNVTGLQRANETYNNVIRTLPFFTIQEMAASLGLNILELEGKDILVNARRAAGQLRPYFVGCSASQQAEIMKFVEMACEPQKVYANYNDNIQNYTEKKVLSNAGEIVSDTAKRHPLEYEIIKNIILSFAEDICDAAFFGERDEEGTSVLSSFNGFFTTLDSLTTSGLIADAEGNLVTTGEIAAPATTADVAAYTKLVDFLRHASPSLQRTGNVQLMISQSALYAVKMAYKNKCGSFADPTTAQLLESVRDISGIPSLQFKSHTALGTGSKLILSAPGLFDLGRGTSGGSNFVDVRQVDADPNNVQFWIQDSYDTRVKDVHKKVFLTNEQSNTAASQAGDYVPA